MRKFHSTWFLCCILLCLIAVAGCGSNENAAPASQPDPETLTAKSDEDEELPDSNSSANQEEEAEAQSTVDEEQTHIETVEHPLVQPENTQKKEPASSQPEPEKKDEHSPAKAKQAKPAVTDAAPAQTPTPAPALAPSPASAESTDSKPSTQVHIVEIVDFAFSPSELTIKAGDSVKFINKDAVGHSATADDKSFDTGMLDQDGAKEITYTKDGNFTYFCLPHPAMKGTIIVTD